MIVRSSGSRVGSLELYHPLLVTVDVAYGGISHNVGYLPSSQRRFLWAVKVQGPADFRLFRVRTLPSEVS